MRPIDYAVAALTGALCASLLLGKARADEILIHGPSYHFTSGHNNQNWGLGYRSGNWIAGGYYNSEYEPSVYGGRRLPITQDFGVILGLVAGYQACVVCPAALLTYRIPVDKSVSVHINAQPLGGGLINLTVGVRH